VKSLVLSLEFLTILISSSAFARPANGTHTSNFARPMNAACEQAKRSSCFLALDGEARERCENGYFEGPSREHFRWMRCSERR
jgi:hypothetical protein